VGVSILLVKPLDQVSGSAIAVVGAATSQAAIGEDTPDNEASYVTYLSNAGPVWLGPDLSADLDGETIEWLKIQSTVKASPTQDIVAVNYLSFGIGSIVARTVFAGTGWQTFADTLYTNPQTGLAWQPADLASWAIGHNMSFADIGSPPLLTQLVVILKLKDPHIKATATGRSPRVVTVEDLPGLKVTARSLSPKATAVSRSPSATAEAFNPPRITDADS
jgi:hypothetical protein